MNAVVSRDAEAMLAAFRDDLWSGRPWFDALLDIVSIWDVATEVVEGREFRYLVGGEAFDWLTLAERLCDAVLPEGLLPPDEVDALLLAEQLPVQMDEATFQERLGAAKYRAHLNFVYGVRVEQGLQLAVEEQVQKERGSTMLAYDARTDGDVFSRIYGATRLDLLREFRTAQGRAARDRISLTELTEFTYWLFKRRLSVQDPARVASDTRRGLATLQRLEELRRRRQAAATPNAPAQAADVIDSVAVAVT
ncbi:MAG: hypothetical protein V3V06_03325 [Dehalococcoidia bacterium]